MTIEYCGRRAKYRVYSGSTARITYRYKNSLDLAAGKHMEKVLLDMKYPMAVAKGEIYVLVNDRKDFEQFKSIYLKIKRGEI